MNRYLVRLCFFFIFGLSFAARTETDSSGVVSDSSFDNENCKYCAFYRKVYGHFNTPPLRPIPGTRSCGHDFYIKGNHAVVDRVLAGESIPDPFPAEIEFKVRKIEKTASRTWTYLEPTISNNNLDVSYLEALYKGWARFIPTSDSKYEIVIFSNN